MKHLYVSDLDGTLLNDSTRVSDESARIITDITQRGGMVTVATARTPATVEMLLADTRIDVPAIVMTGASLWDRSTRRYVDPTLLPASEAAKAVDIFIKNGLEPFVYTVDGEFLKVYHHGEMTAEERHFVDAREGLGLKKFILDATSGQVREAENVILIFGMGDYERLSEIERRLNEAGDYSISFYEDIASPLYYIEVFGAGVSKANAVRKLAKRIGADRITVYGDNLNDLSMMEIADDSVAVANAKEEVLARASRVIGDNNSNSVARDMLRSFNLESEI